MPRWPVYIVLGLLIGITVIFIGVFIVVSTTSPTVSDVDQAAYADAVSALLDDADPARGEPLLTEFVCVTCHVSATGVGVAPPFAGIALRAAERRPPLTAAEYIYESITNPNAYVVQDYAAAMPQDYPQRLTDNQLGDLIAYLLTLDQEAD